MKNKRVILLPFIVASIYITAQCLVIILLSSIKSYNSTPIIEDSRGSFLSQGDGTKGDFGYWVIEDSTNLRVRSSIISIEDRRFYKHFGIDFRAILRAVRENVVNKTPQGASTIAMQVVRIQEQSRRNIITKIYETLAAYVMTVRFGREAVLDQYMKIVPLGKRIHGFSYASRRYFKKPIEDLSWAEGAILSSLPKAPGQMNLTTYRGMRIAKDRAVIVLKRMFDQEYIDSDIYSRELKLLESFKAISLENRPTSSYHYILRLTDELNKRGLKPYNGVIKSTFDSKIQEYLREYVSGIYSKLTLSDANNIAIIVADKNGAILGYIGSENYFNKKAGGSINYANRRRSSGSTLKPFLYIKGLDDKVFFPNSIVDDLPIHIISEEGSFIAANYDEDFLGPMLYRNTLANSRNIPAVRILEEVGLSSVYNYFNNLNFVHRDLSPAYFGYGMILGGLYVTLEDLVTAYGSILNDGNKFSLKWFEGDDNIRGVSAGSSYNSRLISDFLSDPIARLPSFKRLGALEYNYPVAVKTGTSQGFRDAWTIAYSQDYITGIWIGRSDNGKMNHFSGSTAAEYLKPIMNYLHPEELKGMNQKPFYKPANSKEVNICTLSGEISGPNCDNSITEIFRESEVPVDICSVHISIAIDIRTGTIADHQTPLNKIKIKAYTKLPSKYSVWSQKNGIEKPLFSTQEINKKPMIKIIGPVDGARYLYDYEIPSRFQTIPLIANVEPELPDVEWIINGEILKKEPYPYKIRFSLEPGIYDIQAVNNSIISEIIRIYVE